MANNRTTHPTPLVRSLADVLTTPYDNGSGQKHAAYQIPWDVVHDLLGIGETEVDDDGFAVLPAGTPDDDGLLTAWLLDQGAAEWVANAPGWIDECGWGVAGPALTA